MNRDHGSRLIGNRSASQLGAAIVALTIALLAIVLFQPAAHAATITITTSDGGQQANITTGDAVTFKVGPVPTLATGLLFCGPGIPQQTSGCPGPGSGKGKVYGKGATIATITFAAAGQANYGWVAYFVAGAGSTGIGTATITVTDPPPPPNTSTPAGPGSSTPAGGGTSGVPSSGVPGTPGTSGTATGSKPSGSKSSASVGGISIVPAPIIATNNIPIGFNGPGIDPHNSTPVIPDPGSGVGAIPSNAGAETITPSNAPSQQGSIVEVAKSTPTKSRPTTLAIISIAVLAIVSTLYAYRRLGEQATRPGH